MLPLHLQNEVIHPEGRIQAGFGKEDVRREMFLRGSRRALEFAFGAEIPVVHVRMAFSTDGSDLPENCELYRSVKKRGVMREGSWGAEFYDGLGPRDHRDKVVSHNRVNAFYESELASTLSALQCTHLMMFGVATHSVVEHSARHAVDMGYSVTIIEDACSANPPERHQHSLTSIGNLVTLTQSSLLGLTDESD